MFIGEKMKEAYKWLAVVMFVLAAITVVVSGILFDIMRVPLNYDLGGAILALMIWMLAIGLMAFGAYKFGASLRSKMRWFKHWKNVTAFVLILIGLLLIFFAIKYPFVYTYFVKVPGRAYALETVYTFVPIPENGIIRVVKDVGLVTWQYYEVVAYHQVWVQTPLFLTGLALIILGLLIGYWSIYSGNIKFEKELMKE